MTNVNLKFVFLAVLLGSTQIVSAKDWFGGNKFFGNNRSNFYGNNNCNDWPEWTPMYWMEEMMGDNNCNNNSYRSNLYGNLPYGGGAYGNPYGAYYPQPANGYGQYPSTPYYPQSNRSRFPAFGSGFSPFGSSYRGGFPRLGSLGGTSPFTSFSTFPSMRSSSPLNSFGSPMSSPFGASGFGSPMSSMGMGGMGSPMSSMGMGGMGSPMSPMGMGGMGSPMSPMGMNGMSSPFGRSFSPFR